MNQTEFDKSMEQNADSFLQTHDLTSAVEAFLAKEECCLIVESAFSILKEKTPLRAKSCIAEHSEEFGEFFKEVRKCFKLLVRLTLPDSKEEGQEMKCAFALQELRYFQELAELCGRMVKRRNGHF